MACSPIPAIAAMDKSNASSLKRSAHPIGASIARDESKMDLNSILQHSRQLREKGQGQQVRDILLGLSDYGGTAIEVAQIGIEMNYVGLFRQAEDMLERAIATSKFSGFNLYLANGELCIAKYSLGKLHDAHALFRSTRRMRDQVIQHWFSWTKDEAFNDLIRDKILGDNPVSGKSILVVHEGGFGDLVMHSRYLGALKRDGARVIYAEIPEPASGMFEDEPSIIEIGDVKALLPKADFVTSNFDLYARYQHSPFLFCPDWNIRLFPHASTLPVQAQSLLDLGRQKLRIGIISTSNSTVRHEPFRSIPFRALVPLFEAFRDADPQFYCLNKGGTCEFDPQEIAKYGIADLGPTIGTFADTAAVLRQLNLLISIDTGPAHLAGALGVPVWLLLSAACDSRWYDGRHCTPWYDSMRLYRQEYLGDWTQPIECLIADLRRLRRPAVLPH